MTAFLIPYGQAATIRTPLYKKGTTNHARSTDWTPATGDVKVSKDGGAYANVATLPTATDAGSGTAHWNFSVSSSSATCAEGLIIVDDPAIEHTCIRFETVGHPSARWPDPTVVADMVSISGDATAADRLEAILDGADTIPADMIKVSGDATAADALEAVLDGAATLPVNVTQVSGDATAADTLEAWLDGVTLPNVNVGAISGDTAAADNLEAWLDGTGAAVRSIATKGLTQSGATLTQVVLAAGASATNSAYTGMTIVFQLSGNPFGVIATYNGTTKVATFTAPLDVIIPAGTAYVIEG